MSIRVGIVAEGRSEWLVLEATMRSLCRDIEFDRIRPDYAPLSGSPAGWRGVKAWCEENGERLELFLTGVPSRPIHLLLIHADCSMADKVGAARNCPPAVDTADALRVVILQQWLGLETQPPYLLIVNPSMSTDCWVVAALGLKRARPCDIECDPQVEEVLVREKHLRRKGGEIKKPEGRYQPLADAVATNLNSVRTQCTQAERFCAEFLAVVLK